MFKIRITDQDNVQVTGMEKSVVNSVGTYECEFSFDESWRDMQIFACFKSNTLPTEKQVLLTIDEEGKGICTIPWEVLQAAGILYAGVCGFKDAKQVKPTVWKQISTIEEGVDPNGQLTTIPSPSVVAQILDLAESAEDKATEALEKAGEAAEDIETLQGDVSDLTTVTQRHTVEIGELNDGKLDKSAVKGETGQSTTDTMSQKAITDELATKLDRADVDGKLDKVTTEKVEGYYDYTSPVSEEWWTSGTITITDSSAFTSWIKDKYSGETPFNYVALTLQYGEIWEPEPSERWSGTVRYYVKNDEGEELLQLVSYDDTESFPFTGSEIAESNEATFYWTGYYPSVLYKAQGDQQSIVDEKYLHWKYDVLPNASEFRNGDIIFLDTTKTWYKCIGGKWLNIGGNATRLSTMPQLPPIYERGGEPPEAYDIYALGVIEYIGEDTPNSYIRKGYHYYLARTSPSQSQAYEEYYWHQIETDFNVLPGIYEQGSIIQYTGKETTLSIITLYSSYAYVRVKPGATLKLYPSIGAEYDYWCPIATFELRKDNTTDSYANYPHPSEWCDDFSCDPIKLADAIRERYHPIAPDGGYLQEIGVGYFKDEQALSICFLKCTSIPSNRDISKATFVVDKKTWEYDGPTKSFPDEEDYVFSSGTGADFGFSGTIKAGVSSVEFLLKGIWHTNYVKTSDGYAYESDTRGYLTCDDKDKLTLSTFVYATYSPAIFFLNSYNLGDTVLYTGETSGRFIKGKKYIAVSSGKWSDSGGSAFADEGFIQEDKEIDLSINQPITLYINQKVKNTSATLPYLKDKEYTTWQEVSSAEWKWMLTKPPVLKSLPNLTTLQLKRDFYNTLCTNRNAGSEEAIDGTLPIYLESGQKYYFKYVNMSEYAWEYATANIRYTTSEFPSLYNFSELTWEEISHICRTSDPSTYWKVGDWKMGTMMGQFIPFTIIGFNHDTVSNVQSYGKPKASITLISGIPGGYALAPDTRGMFTVDEVKTFVGQSSNIVSPVGRVDYYADSPTKVCYWGADDSFSLSGTCYPIRSFATNIVNSLDTDFASAVVPVVKQNIVSLTNPARTSNPYYTATVETIDRLCLLSETELLGKTVLGLGYEGEQYELFKNYASKYMNSEIGFTKLPIGTDSYRRYWLRSQSSTGDGSQAIVVACNKSSENTVGYMGESKNINSVNKYGFVFTLCL